MLIEKTDYGLIFYTISELSDEDYVDPAAIFPL